MSSIECPRENEVVMAVASRRWPDRCDAELSAHIQSCAICRDVATVALALDEQEFEHAAVPVPSSAHMWWRLQMQARHDAARTAARPVAVAQMVAAAAAVVLGVVMVGVTWMSESAPLSQIFGRLWSLDLGSADAVLSSSVAAPQTLLAVAAIALGLVLMPVAVYFALSE